METAVINQHQGKHVWHTHFFGDESSARRYLAYVKSVVPDPDSTLAKANIQRNKHKQYYFKLTQEQVDTFHQFFQKTPLSSHEAMTSSSTQSMQNISDHHPAHEPNTIRPIKSVRWDAYCFVEDFLLGITPTPQNQPHHTLRYGPHRAFAVFAAGV